MVGSLARKTGNSSRNLLRRRPSHTHLLMLTSMLKQAACGLFFFVVWASVAKAASFGVSPVRVTLSETQQMDAITVRNDGTEPVSMQLEVLNWSQEAGKDVLTPSRELLANPPIFTVPAGGSQLVRVGLRRAPDGQRELTYRICLQELPPPPKPDFMGSRDVDARQPAGVCFTRGRR